MRQFGTDALNYVANLASDIVLALPIELYRIIIDSNIVPITRDIYKGSRAPT
jgi:hypothetical protein